MTSTRLASITATVLISIAIACGDSYKPSDSATGGANGGTDALAANDAPTAATDGDEQRYVSKLECTHPAIVSARASRSVRRAPRV